MTLIERIVKSVTENQDPVADTLRLCLVLAHELSNDKLEAWATSELQGYQDDIELPDYRKATGVARGNFIGPLNLERREQPLPPAVLDPEDRHFARNIRLTQPIASYESIPTSDRLQLPWPANLVFKYQYRLISGMTLYSAWMDIPPSLITGLVDTVRTRLLMFALEIQKEVNKGQKDLKKVSPEVVNQIVSVTIFGNNNVIGGVSQFSASIVLERDMQSLKNALSALGASDDECSELEASMREDGIGDKAAKRTLGEKTLNWIGRVSNRIGQSGMKIGKDVAAEIIKRYIFSYIGFAP